MNVQCARLGLLEVIVAFFRNVELIINPRGAGRSVGTVQ